MLRKEDAELVTGEGRYVDDIKLPGMLHMAIVRSPHAHGEDPLDRRLRGARGRRRGRRAHRGRPDFAAGVPCATNPTGRGARPPERPPLATDSVRHVGEPRRRGRRDRSRTPPATASTPWMVDYEQLPAVIGVEYAALAAGAPRVHEDYRRQHLRA